MTELEEWKLTLIFPTYIANKYAAVIIAPIRLRFLLPALGLFENLTIIVRKLTLRAMILSPGVAEKMGFYCSS